LRAGVGRLALFHLSDRYRPEKQRATLDEARAELPATAFSEGWTLAPEQHP
jgi:ribonuclease BN (tRNA processing enzyme)